MVLSYMCRHIFGWGNKIQKQQARIAVGAIADGYTYTDDNGQQWHSGGTGMAESTIRGILKTLCSFGIVKLCETDAHDPENKKGQLWELSFSNIAIVALKARYEIKRMKQQARTLKARAKSPLMSHITPYVGHEATPHVTHNPTPYVGHETTKPIGNPLGNPLNNIAASGDAGVSDLERQVVEAVGSKIDELPEPDKPKPAPKPRERDRLFDGVVLLCWGIDLVKVETELSKDTAKRVGIIVKWLKERGKTPEQLWLWAKWYKETKSNLAFPRRIETFETNWLEWESNGKPVITPATVQNNTPPVYDPANDPMRVIIPENERIDPEKLRQMLERNRS